MTFRGAYPVPAIFKRQPAIVADLFRLGPEPKNMPIRILDHTKQSGAAIVWGPP